MSSHIRILRVLGKAVKAESTSSGAIANIIYITTLPTNSNDIPSRHELEKRSRRFEQTGKGTRCWPMSALGQRQTCAVQKQMNSEHRAQMNHLPVQELNGVGPWSNFKTLPDADWVEFAP